MIMTWRCIYQIHRNSIFHKPVYTVLLTLMLVVANFANTIWCKKPKDWLKPWHMGTYLRVLRESYPMNTNMTGFRWLSKIKSLLLRVLDGTSLSIGMVKVKGASSSGILIIGVSPFAWGCMVFTHVLYAAKFVLTPNALMPFTLKQQKALG